MERSYQNYYPSPNIGLHLNPNPDLNPYPYPNPNRQLDGQERNIRFTDWSLDENSPLSLTSRGSLFNLILVLRCARVSFGVIQNQRAITRLSKSLGNSVLSELYFLAIEVVNRFGK